MQQALRLGLAALALISTTVLVRADDKPATNVNPNRHPNLAAAQLNVLQAFKALERAQQANEFDLGGHAAKAKALLEQANDEIKEAAKQSNDNKKK